jgi:hypothetical protein
MSSIWADPTVEDEQLNLGPNATSLDLLRAIYRNPTTPLHMRIRCAMSCLKHEHPTLGITYQTSDTEDFANLLDARIRRMNEAKLIEHQPLPARDGTVEIKRPLAHTVDRRFRRL